MSSILRSTARLAFRGDVEDGLAGDAREHRGGDAGRLLLTAGDRGHQHVVVDEEDVAHPNRWPSDFETVNQRGLTGPGRVAADCRARMRDQ